MNDLQRIAVVIDADNAKLSKIGDVLREVSAYGRIVVKRAYGNWRKDALKNWGAEIKRLAIKAQQQFDYVSGKNATDMALVIDVMDLLHTESYDAFVIVSSDSDYTPLAVRLRESGVYVMGVGDKKTPASFKNSCDEFLLLENLSERSGGKGGAEAEEALPAPAAKAAAPETDTAAESCGEAQEDIQEIHDLLRSAYARYQDDNGFANVAPVGNFIKRAKPDFDCRTYGYAKLSQFLQAFPKKYQVQKRVSEKGGSAVIVTYKCIGRR